MEGSVASPKKKGKGSESGLVDLVFSWSLQDIRNEDLYKSKVEKIPLSFQSVSHYLGSYHFPLLEETRAELSSAMELISRAPYAQVISLEESKPYGTSLYNLIVDSWKNKHIGSGKKPYRTLPGDIFIIIDAKVESVSDIEHPGRAWTLAWVPKLTDEEEYCMKVKAAKVIDTMSKTLYVIFLINLTTNNRIWMSLHLNGNMNIIKPISCVDSMVEEICDSCSLYSNAMWAEKLSSRLSPTLNDSQKQAVLTSLCKLNCDHKSSVELIWGPPGTGKTKTVSMLLWSILGMNYRILSCAPTNIAITELATRVVKLLKESSGVNSTRGISICSLGNVLLFGNEDRLKVKGELEEIFVDHRVDRLAQCFGPSTHWKHSIASMVDTLENCVCHYQVFLENELNKAEETKQKIDKKSFLQFMKERFNASAVSLKRCIKIICTHIPKSFILESNFQGMIHLLELLDSFKSLLSRDDLPSEGLEGIFSQPAGVQDSPNSFTSAVALQCIRTQCLSVLRNLQCSLAKLKFPSGVAKIRKFCFQQASLIFCTSSSSFKLHLMKMEPLSLLVIDEAAQMKECESTIPLQLPGIRHAILIGDEYQLPATLHSKLCNEAGFGRSLFERLSMFGHSKHLLNMQYRMHPLISCFPNSKIYHNQILDAPSVRSNQYPRQYLPGPMFGPYSFINIYGGREVQDEVGYSRRNMVEVGVVTKLIQNIYKAWNGSKEKLSIGVISPYASQVTAIQEKLGRKFENFQGFTVKVKTIDGFQGGEDDIVIISLVKSNSHGSIGFLSNPQRANVALTRARRCLWILGNARAMVNSKSIWEDVVCDAKNRGCLFNADEDKDLAKAILEVKKEHIKIDDLLNGDSILFKCSRWKVLFSQRFWRSFGKLHSIQMKKLVIMFILRLSCGWRPPKTRKESVCKSSLKMLKQYKIENLYLVCTIDIEKDLKYTQLLKIWDILYGENVPVLVKCLDSIFKLYTDEFLEQCNVKYLEGDLELPKSWVITSDIPQYRCLDDTEYGSDSCASFLDCFEDPELKSLSHLKFHCLSYNVMNYMLSQHNSTEFQLPFAVTDQELDIILFDRSAFVTGRPGTIKQNILTLKMLQKEWQHHKASERLGEEHGSKSEREIDHDNGKGGSILRQIFVTVSSMSCASVKRRVSTAKSTRHGGSSPAESDPIDLQDVDRPAGLMDIPDSFIYVPPASYPLVVTFRKFLMMLDGSVGDSYFTRFCNNELFHGEKRLSQSFIQAKEATYEKFASCYWPYFDPMITKFLESSMVFSEIMFYIKGGWQAGVSCDSPLGREDYVLFSKSRMPSLRQWKRELIYDIFIQYEETKLEREEFDLADLVIDLHCRLNSVGYKGEKMDFIYIDEVQNLSMRQVALFKHLCRNTETGFSFLSDTAQTLARGFNYNYRFADIRGLFNKEFVPCAERGAEKGYASDIIHLNRNFYANASVLKIAQSILELLFHFFPLSIDILSPETSEKSILGGQLPALIQSEFAKAAVSSIFKTKANRKMISGFGPHQVILVRDNRARNEILVQVGKQALILTVMECKGLEFQDVLLYKFFGSSPLKKHWGMIYQYMSDQGMLDSSSLPFPSFNPQKVDSGLCWELKLLYLAITRARHRLWICEDVEEVSNPVFDYWKKLCLVQVRELDDSLVQEMQMSSSKEEWVSQGIKLYSEGNYEMAKLCFERAEDTAREKWAHAAGLQKAAIHILGSNPRAAYIDLKKAGEIFYSIGRDDSAAICFIEAKEYERAGRVYMDSSQASRLEDAGDCFLLGQCYKLAAEVYAKGKHYSKCLRACCNGKNFYGGLQYIQEWKENATLDGTVQRSQELEKLEEAFLKEAAFHFHEDQDNTSMMYFVKKFHSMESKRSFLKTMDCFDELLSLEEDDGNFMEAADIARHKGDQLLEAALLDKAGRFKDSSRLILSFVFTNSLWACGSTGWPLKNFDQKKELLTRAKAIAKKHSDLFLEYVSKNSDILSDQETTLSEMQKFLSTFRRDQNLRGEILSTRKVLDVHLKLDASVYKWENGLISEPSRYIQSMISQNQVSMETMVHFWTLWKEKMINLLEYLHSPETKIQAANDHDAYGKFCLDYLGVHKRFDNHNTIYHLRNPSAHWIKMVGVSVQPSKSMVSIDVSKYVSAAQSYWCLEVVWVGMRVLEKLSTLHIFTSQNSISLFCQTMAAMHLFGIAKFLTSFKFLKSFSDDKALQNFLDSSEMCIFKNLFPLNWSKSLTDDMITLRGTKVSNDVLKDVVLKNIYCCCELKNKNIECIVMIMLGSVKLTVEMYEMIATWVKGNKKWESLIDAFKFHTIGLNLPYDGSKVLEAPKEDSLMDDIISHLPSGFSEVLKNKRGRCTFLDKLAVALLKIENPLVIVSSEDTVHKLTCVDAIIINAQDISHREDIMRVLFPKDIDLGSQSSKPCKGGLSLSINLQGKRAKLPALLNPSKASNLEQKITEDDGEYDSHYNNGTSKQISGSAKSVKHLKDGSQKSHERKMSWVKKSIKNVQVLVAAPAQSAESSTCRTKNGIHSFELDSMPNNLMQLQASSKMSGEELKGNIATTEVHLERLHLVSDMAPSFNNLKLQKETCKTSDSVMASQSTKNNPKGNTISKKCTTKGALEIPKK
ncbi:DNA2/NAM7 helicase, helicase domain, partial [Dillenia turbinata]